jgi:hypothetical protein
MLFFFFYTLKGIVCLQYQMVLIKQAQAFRKIGTEIQALVFFFATLLKPTQY